MIRAPSAGSWKENGRTRAMVADDPRPGSTPMIIPTKTPMKTYSRFSGSRTTENPEMIESIVSIWPSRVW
jgi:hypothetical protein